MNTKPQQRITLTAPGVEARLIKLSRRAFKSAVDDVELDLLVAVTTGRSTTFTVSDNIWEAVLRHHGHAAYPFDETDNEPLLVQYRDEASQVFHRLAATAGGRLIDDGYPMSPNMDDTYTNLGTFKELLQRGGEIVNYVCSLPGCFVNGKDVASALGEDGMRVIQGYFAIEWLYMPGELGYALATHGLGGNVRNLRGVSIALIAATKKHEAAETDADKRAQQDVIEFLRPLLKGLVLGVAESDRSAAENLSAAEDNTVTLLEHALDTTVLAGNLVHDTLRTATRLQAGMRDRFTLMPTEQILEALHERLRHEARLRHSIWED